MQEHRQATIGVPLGGLFIGFLSAACIFAAGRRRRTVNPNADLDEALERGEFLPYYQPLIDIQNGRLVGCEVLVRWRRPDGTMVPPGSFIDRAERSGFIFPLTLYLMRQVERDLGTLYAERRSLKCSFNLCAAHFASDQIIADVETIFTGAGIALDQVLLEVTERDPLPDVDLARTIIARFQAKGVRIALDDVGTGHGGMSYLLKLGVDTMKIDKLFIDALGAERQSTAIVDSLIDLAAHLKMDVVAEGVERIEQVEALRRRGVRVAQGYAFSPALSAGSYTELARAMVPARTAMSTSSVAARRA